MVYICFYFFTLLSFVLLITESFYCYVPLEKFQNA